MNYEFLSYLVILLPLSAFIINGLFTRNLLGSASIYAGYITISSIFLSFMISLILLFQIMVKSEQFIFDPISWISILLE